MSKKIFIILMLAVLFLPSFSLIAQAQGEGNGVQLPGSVEEAKGIAGKALKTTEKEMPGNMKKIWQEQILPIWTKMYGWFNTNIWMKIWPAAQKEIQKREPGIKEDLETKKGETKEELKTGIPKLSQDIRNLWQQFKELIK